MFFKKLLQSWLLRGRCATPPRPDTQLSLEPAEEGQQAISLDDICRLPQILRAQRAFTHTHVHTKNKKELARAWLHFRNFVRKR